MTHPSDRNESTETHLFVEQAHLSVGGFVSLGQLHGNFVHAVHQGFVNNPEPSLTQLDLLALSIVADPDVIPVCATTRPSCLSYTISEALCCSLLLRRYAEIVILNMN